MNAKEALSLLQGIQREATVKNAGWYWDRYPEYRYGKTRDEAIERASGEVDEGNLEWDDLSTGEFDGHTIKVVEDFGGEGQGDTRYVVIKIDEQFFRKDGYYASYAGSSWDGDFREVTPAQRTITVYE